MSTLKNNITARRLTLLTSKTGPLFHIKELAHLWSIKNPNTLRVTLKRYVESGLMYRIYRGFYSLLPMDQLSPFLIGTRALHRFCYLSGSTVLHLAGYRSQPVHSITFMSEKPARFNIGEVYYLSHKLNPKYLYQTEGLVEKDGFYMATAERAIADTLYLNPTAHFDKPVDWHKVKTLQKIIGYPLTPQRYDDSATS